MTLSSGPTANCSGSLPARRRPRSSTKVTAGHTVVLLDRAPGAASAGSDTRSSRRSHARYGASRNGGEDLGGHELHYAIFGVDNSRPSRRPAM